MNECRCVKSHCPGIDIVDIHHIWPKAEGGPDHIDNLEPICPTTHRAVHALLRAYKKHNGRPPWKIRKQYNRFQRKLAKAGWKAIQEEKIVKV